MDPTKKRKRKSSARKHVSLSDSEVSESSPSKIRKKRRQLKNFKRIPEKILIGRKLSNYY